MIASAVTAPRINWQHPLNRGLRARWKLLPSGSGLRYLDVSAWANHGVLTGMSPTDYSASKRGTVLEWSSSGQHVLASSLTMSRFSGTIASAAIWVFPDTIASFRTAFSAGEGTRDLCLFLNSATQAWVASGYDIGASATAGSNVWTTKEWQRAGLVCDGSEIRVYRNGVNVATASSAGIGAGFNGEAMRIGDDGAGGGTTWDGKLDDLCVWDRALSAAEMRWDYRATLPGYGAGLSRKRRFFVPAAGFTDIRWQQPASEPVISSPRVVSY